MKSWDRYFMDLALLVASRSKDRSTQVGCVIVGPDNEIRSTGYNSFPRGIADEVEVRHQRPEKYFWIEHSERNAIYNAARVGTPLKGCRIYVPWVPCMDCARAIVQAGIVEIVTEPMVDEALAERWAEHHKRTEVLLAEAGVALRFLEQA